MVAEEEPMVKVVLLKVEEVLFTVKELPVPPVRAKVAAKVKRVKRSAELTPPPGRAVPMLNLPPVDPLREPMR